MRRARGRCCGQLEFAKRAQCQARAGPGSQGELDRQGQGHWVAEEESPVSQPLPSPNPSHLSWHWCSRAEGLSPVSPTGAAQNCLPPQSGPCNWGEGENFGAQSQGCVQDGAHFHGAGSTRVHAHTGTFTCGHTHLNPPPQHTHRTLGRREERQTQKERGSRSKGKVTPLSELHAVSSSAETQESRAHTPWVLGRLR